MGGVYMYIKIKKTTQVLKLMWSIISRDQVFLIIMILLAQVHAPVFVQFPEIRIPQVFDETDGFTG